MIQWSWMNDPKSFEVRSGTSFICEICPCGESKLSVEGEFLITECDHVKMWITNQSVARIESKGIRH